MATIVKLKDVTDKLQSELAASLGWPPSRIKPNSKIYAPVVNSATDLGLASNPDPVPGHVATVGRALYGDKIWNNIHKPYPDDGQYFGNLAANATDWLNLRGTTTTSDLLVPILAILSGIPEDEIAGDSQPPDLKTSTTNFNAFITDMVKAINQKMLNHTHLSENDITGGAESKIKNAPLVDDLVDAVAEGIVAPALAKDRPTPLAANGPAMFLRDTFKRVLPNHTATAQDATTQDNTARPQNNTTCRTLPAWVAPLVIVAGLGLALLLISAVRKKQS